MSEHSRCTDSAFELCPRTEAGNEATPGACLGDFFVHFVPFIGHAAIYHLVTFIFDCSLPHDLIWCTFWLV